MHVTQERFQGFHDKSSMGTFLSTTRRAGRMLRQQQSSLCAPIPSSRGMPFSATRRAGRMLRQQLFSICAPAHKKGRLKTCLFGINSLCSFNPAGFQTIGTDVHSLSAAVNFALNSLDIGFPHCVGLSMRMAYVITKKNALTTNITFSHFDTSSTPACFCACILFITLVS